MSSQTTLKVEPEYVEIDIVVRRADGKVETMHFYQVDAGSLNSRYIYHEQFKPYSPYQTLELAEPLLVKTMEFRFDPKYVDGKVYTYTVDTPTDDVVG